MTARSLAPAPRSGWDRLAQAVAQVIPPTEVDAVWLFPPLRRDANEWGTAVLSRVEGERRRIYTARYILAVRGKERGKFDATIQDVGTGPVEVLTRVVRDAERRSDDEYPPTPVAPDQWFASLPQVPAGSDGPPR
jgi:hypothetical protein